MALITQIKVGGTTYDVSMKAGNGIAIGSTGDISVRIGTGLFFDGGVLCLTGVYTGLGMGLKEENGTLDVRVSSGLAILADGLGVNIGRCFTIGEDGSLMLKISTGLKFDDGGALTTIA